LLEATWLAAGVTRIAYHDGWLPREIKQAARDLLLHEPQSKQRLNRIELNNATLGN